VTASQARDVAVVTGAGGGIGQAIALRLAADGADVVVLDIDGSGAEQTAERIRAAGMPAIGLACDVADADDVRQAFDLAVHRGPVRILVNNAGIAHGAQAEQHLFDTTDSMWDRVMDVNLNGAFRCTRAAAHLMVPAGGGCIVNVSSAGAGRAHRHRVAYDATKGAIEAATRALALDLAPWRIRVNAVAPGMIDVASRTPIGDESVVPPSDVVPLGKRGRAEDVAGAVSFLASSDAAYITGAVVVVDGGLSAQLRPPALDVPVPGHLLRRMERQDDPKSP
jgi:3-oxoacyl-[acyl-carrier protein] reductase